MLNDAWFHGLTPPEQLREALTQLENKLGKLEHSEREEALDILLLFDRAFTLLTELQAQGATLPGEQARFETVTKMFRKKAKLFLRTVGGMPAFRRGRVIPPPDSARWWWFVDAWHAEQQRAQLMRTLRLLGIAAALFAVFTMLYMVFLSPDKATREWIHHQNEAERLAVSGDYANALAEVNAALAAKPNIMELHVLKGILEERLEQTQAAKKSFLQAQVLANNQEDLLLERAQKYLLFGAPDQAMADADAILADNAKSASGYLLKAQTYESRNALAEADNAYAIAIELAAAADQIELEALVRVQRAYLLQRMMPAMP